MLDSGGNQSGSKDRVTLKKEIGLLSACAIIIGEIYFLILTCQRVLSNQLELLSLRMFLCLSFYHCLLLFKILILIFSPHSFISFRFNYILVLKVLKY